MELIESAYNCFFKFNLKKNKKKRLSKNMPLFFLPLRRYSFIEVRGKNGILQCVKSLYLCRQVMLI